MQIRKLRSPQEYLEAEELQRAIWQFPDREIVPLNELVVMQKHGGHVFGAFDRGPMVGFCFGCPAYHEGATYHYSRMLGVLPGYQDAGTGYAMKLKQRGFVLDQGLDRVVWTFDPLQARNAHFNLEKLGCVIREYEVNLYPGSQSRFNRGLETDRFTTEWPIASRRVRDRLAGKRVAADFDAFAPAIESRVNDAGWREPARARTSLRDRRISIEIPDDTDALKGADLKAAQVWRRVTRQAFTSYLGRGYVIGGFHRRPELNRHRGFYLLEKGLRVT